MGRKYYHNNNYKPRYYKPRRNYYHNNYKPQQPVKKGFFATVFDATPPALRDGALGALGSLGMTLAFTKGEEIINNIFGKKGRDDEDEEVIYMDEDGNVIKPPKGR